MGDYLVVVPGQPVPKARPRVPRWGPNARVYTPRQTRTYEEKVAACARMAGLPPDLEGPLRVHLVLVFERPQSIRRPLGLIWRPRKPDADNVAKAVLDGLSAHIRDQEVTELVIQKVDSEPGGEGRVFVEVTHLAKGEADAVPGWAASIPGVDL